MNNRDNTIRDTDKSSYRKYKARLPYLVAMIAVIMGISLCEKKRPPREVTIPAGSLEMKIGEELSNQTKIAFVSYRDGNSEIYIMNPDGSNQENLTNNPARDGGPEWLPDGKIKFRSNRDGSNKEYVIDLHGNIMPPIEEPNEPKTRSYTPQEIHDRLNNMKPVVFSTSKGSSYAIVKLDPFTGKTITLSKGHSSPPDTAVSPDGKYIVYNGSRWTSRQIYSMNVNGGEKRRLTGIPGTKLGPCWSPDGKMIAFSLINNETAKIYIMNANGSGLRRITNGRRDESPSWSPFLTSEEKAEKGE